jgi:hypothetical protein
MRMRIAGAAVMVSDYTTGGYPCLVNIDQMADSVMCTKRLASPRSSARPYTTNAAKDA